MDSSRTERQGLQDGGETCCDVWFEAKSQEAELVAELKMLGFFLLSDKDGQV